jgi:enamine deaminase RidA (YjgF/YER057c/UK114 family)
LASRGFNVDHLSFAGMSQAVHDGHTIYLSGQVALAEDGSVVGPDDAHAQAQQCFRNVESVLQAAGGRLEDVVQLTCYLTDVKHFDAYADVKRQVFPRTPPSSTTVVVAGLLIPELLMEVAAIAVPGDTDQPRR